MSIAPPSKTSKGVYRWINRRRIATAPEWLLDIARKPAYVPRKSDGERQADIAELTLAMAMIPNDDLPWDPDKNSPGWNKVGMALYAATAGSTAGLRLFDAWSHRSS
jgi:hypothetical protein